MLDLFIQSMNLRYVMGKPFASSSWCLNFGFMFNNAENPVSFFLFLLLNDSKFILLRDKHHMNFCLKITHAVLFSKLVNSLKKKALRNVLNIYLLQPLALFSTFLFKHGIYITYCLNLQYLQ